MSSNVGAIKGKKLMSDVIKDNIIPLTAISLIHQLGLIKYKRFSWYNDPEHADSTVENNINAMLRHFSAHRSGTIIDPESGMPHIFHMACRCGMLITVLYKELMNSDKKMESPKTNVSSSVGVMITGEELISLSKPTECEVINDDDTVIETEINSYLMDYTLDMYDESIPEDILNEPFWFDELFKLVCRYVSNVWRHTDIRNYIQYDKLTQELSTIYFDNILLKHDVIVEVNNE